VNTVELEFNPNEEFLQNNTYMGAHSLARIDNYNGDSIRQKLGDYAQESNLENYFMIVGFQSDQELSPDNFQVLEPDNVELAGETDRTVSSPGIPGYYLSDMEKIDEYLNDKMEPNAVGIGFTTQPVVCPRYDTRKEQIGFHEEELEEKWPAVTWYEDNSEGANLFKYRKGELTVVSLESPDEISPQEIDRQDAVERLASQAPFESESAFERDKKQAVHSASLQRDTAEEERLVDQIESLSIPVEREEE